MKVKLIRIIKEHDSEQNYHELAKYFKDVDLMIEPAQYMRITQGTVNFYIDYIEQDLNTQNIILIELFDIPYYENYNGEGFKKQRDLLSENRWNLL